MRSPARPLSGLTSFVLGFEAMIALARAPPADLHNNTSTEIEALRKLRTDGKIPQKSADKILDDNSKRL
jgi:hypothetical protein